MGRRSLHNRKHSCPRIGIRERGRGHAVRSRRTHMVGDGGNPPFARQFHLPLPSAPRRYVRANGMGRPALPVPESEAAGCCSHRFLAYPSRRIGALHLGFHQMHRLPSRDSGTRSSARQASPYRALSGSNREPLPGCFRRNGKPRKLGHRRGAGTAFAGRCPLVHRSGY